jgi:hypothetical protein
MFILINIIVVKVTNGISKQSLLSCQPVNLLIIPIFIFFLKNKFPTHLIFKSTLLLRSQWGHDVNQLTKNTGN